MRALVIGGTGLLGARVVALLVALGHQVRALARRPPKAPTPSAEYHSADLESCDLAALLDGCELLVHAAGADYRFVPKGPAWDFFRRTNVDAVLRLFQAAELAGVKRAVLVSSCYHVLKPELAIIHPYVRSLAESERRVRELDGQMEVVIVQPGFVLGTCDQDRPSMGCALARYVMADVPLLAPPGAANLIAASSAAEAITRALFRGRAGDRFLVGDENLAWTALFERFAAAAGRPRRATVLPFPADKRDSAAVRNLLYGRGETHVRLFAWSRFVASDSLTFDTRRSQNALGYAQGNLDDGIRECVESEHDFCRGSANTALTRRSARVG